MHWITARKIFISIGEGQETHFFIIGYIISLKHGIVLPNGQFYLTGCYRNQNTTSLPPKPTLVIAFRCQQNRSTESGPAAVFRALHAAPALD